MGEYFGWIVASAMTGTAAALFNAWRRLHRSKLDRDYAEARAQAAAEAEAQANAADEAARSRSGRISRRLAHRATGTMFRWAAQGAIAGLAAAGAVALIIALTRNLVG